MIVDDKIPDIFSKENYEISAQDATKLYNASSFEPFSAEKAVKAASMEYLGQLVKLPAQAQAIYGQYVTSKGQQIKDLGGYVKNISDKIGKVLPEGNVIFDGKTLMEVGNTIQEVGMVNIKTANRNLEELNKTAKKVIPALTDEERESWTYNIAQGGLNYGTMLALSAFNPNLGLGYIGAITAGGETEEGLENYKRLHGGSLEGYEAQAGKDLTLNMANTAVQTILERAFGAPAQLKFFRSAKDYIKAGAGGFMEEFLTENLQNVTDAVFDKMNSRFEGLTDKNGNPLTVWSVVMSQIKGTIVAGMFGGAAGVGFATYNRAQTKQLISDSISNVVPPEDLKKTVDAIYDSANLSTKNIVAKELENSSSLVTKRGEVFENMNNETVKLVKSVKERGGFKDLQTEDDIAAYSRKIAETHADWVLKEATRRNTTIQEVIDTTGIGFDEETGLILPMTKGAEGATGSLTATVKKPRVYNPEKMSLLTYLKYNGGLKDSGGELKAMDAGKQFVGLINNKSGRSLDDAALNAWEQGYFPQFSERPSINDLLDAIRDSLAGKKIYRESYREKVEKKKERAREAESEGMLDEYLSDFFSDEDLATMSQADKERFYEEIQEQANAISEEDYIQQELDSLNENESERYAMMRENGATHEEAMNDINRAREEALGDIFKLMQESQEDDYEVKKVSGDRTAIEEQKGKNAEYNKLAKDYYGTTNKLSETGYILTDGSLLDFSGKKFGGSPNNRSIDHREIVDALEKAGMEEFINSGNIRYLPEGDKILLSNEPTPAQYRVIERIINNSGGNITIELMGDANKWGMNRNDYYGEYEDTTFNKVKRDINAFYKGTGVREITSFFQGEKGSIQFEGDKALIKLTEQADSTTLPHELAHYYLQNTFLYTKSGLASPEYMENFKQIAKYLGITEDQETIKEWQQEKFARAYEMYQMGKAPEGMEIPLTKYQEWLRSAYGKMQQPMYRDENGELKVPEFDYDTMKMFASLAGETLTEPQFKENQEKVRGLAKTTSEMAKQKGIETETPMYEPRSSTEMGKKADEFIKNNKQLAIDIVKGLAPEQEGLFRQDLFAALRELALNEGDSDLLNELSRSMTVEEATELGQRIQALARGTVDPVKQMTELRDERMKKNKVTKKEIKEETKKATKEIKKEIALAAQPKEWQDFIKSLEC